MSSINKMTWSVLAGRMLLVAEWRSIIRLKLWNGVMRANQNLIKRAMQEQLDDMEIFSLLHQSRCLVYGPFAKHTVKFYAPTELAH